MSKINLKNEKTKRKYFDFLRESEGFAESTILIFERAINLWEDFSHMDDFKKFNAEKAKEFKKWLERRKFHRTGTLITPQTRHSYLMRLNSFFRWLATQNGYKKSVLPSDIGYLKLNRKEAKIAQNAPKRRYPTLAIMRKVISSIQLRTEVDRRDQALIAFTFLSGMRDSAIISLPMGCLDIEILKVDQNPSLGVKTKFTKRIITTLFVFDKSFLKILKDWVVYLRNEKLFTDQDPLFPSTKSELAGKEHHAYIGERIEKKFWEKTGSIRRIFKFRFQQAGVEYFSPHAIRHLIVKLALDKAKTAAEIKAVSQNLGHEKVATTMFDYAALPEEEIDKKIKDLTSETDPADSIK